MKFIITGTAGFIGNELAIQLLDQGHEVVGIDIVNDYYDTALKEARLKRINGHNNFTEARIDLADRNAIAKLFTSVKPQQVLHLAAQAGVRYSITNPHSYADSNLQGFLNILEGCRNNDVEHLVYASSSSVYGANTKVPFAESDAVDHPVSLYAASKKSNELMAHTYSHLYGLPTTGLRFFTVYGPWGRPDMAYFSFTQKILKGESIPVFNHGKHRRDFTYIDDIVNGVLTVREQIPAPNPDWDARIEDPSQSSAPYRIYNIGNNQPVELMSFIQTLEKHLGKEAEKEYLPKQPGDVFETYADITALNKATGYQPTTNIDDGLRQFVEWYKNFYT